MKYSINIDQITLEEWEGKIDMIDCAIITFIRDLNPDNPKIKKLMWRGYFLVKLEWLLDELPMLGIADRTTRRRLQHMCELGILEKLNKRIDGEGIRQLAYYKLSKAFWKAHAKRHKKVEDGIGHEPKKDAEDVHSGDENPRGQNDHRGPNSPRSNCPSPAVKMAGDYSTSNQKTSSQGDAALDGTPKREGEGKKDIAAAVCKCGFTIPRTTAYGCMNCSRPFPDGMNGREYLDSLAGAATG